MRCSICGEEGHNARTCPYKDKRDYAVWMKVDNMTRPEADRFLETVIEDKSRIAPDARGTSAKAKSKDLPSRIQEVMKLPGGSHGTKKK